MALFHHFLTSSDLEGSQDPMQSQIPRLGISFHYVLRLILSLSGFHLVRTSGDKRIHLFVDSEIDPYAEAERHFGFAIREVARAVPPRPGQ